MKVMLAGKAALKDVRFPVLASPKLDGVRAVVIDGTVFSRNMKPIPNEGVQRLFGRHVLNGMDGELIVGSPTSPTAFRDTTSGVMSKEGTPLVTFHVFDHFRHLDKPFADRLKLASSLVEKARMSYLKLVEHRALRTPADLEVYEAACVQAGYEGVMLRALAAPYKNGRSTRTEGGLLKVKRFEDGEAFITGFYEQMENTNEAKRNDAGKLERSSKKSGKLAKGVLGGFAVADCESGVEFNVGTGFTDAEREEYWSLRKQLAGRVIRYRYFPSGSKDKPRFPTFEGFRSPNDL